MGSLVAASAFALVMQSTGLHRPPTAEYSATVVRLERGPERDAFDAGRRFVQKAPDGHEFVMVFIDVDVTGKGWVRLEDFAVEDEKGRLSTCRPRVLIINAALTKHPIEMACEVPVGAELTVARLGSLQLSLDGVENAPITMRPVLIGMDQSFVPPGSSHVDLRKLRAALGKCLKDPGYSPEFELDLDGCISRKEYEFHRDTELAHRRSSSPRPGVSPSQ